MEAIAHHLLRDLEGTPEAFIANLLNELPQHQHLEVLTELLTQSSEIDERIASFVNAAWDWICHNHLWTGRYESLDQYRKALRYTETVRPVVQRHKRSELAKRSYSKTILRHWTVPFEQALPEDVQLSVWSKHLLSLIAILSRYRCRSESIILLRSSMGQRPKRGRTTQRLIPSDVKRALEAINNKEKVRVVEN